MTKYRHKETGDLPAKYRQRETGKVYAAAAPFKDANGNWTDTFILLTDDGSLVRGDDPDFAAQYERVDEDE